MSELTIVDFDRTSFDTDSFAVSLIKNAAEYEHVDEEEMQDLLGALESPDSVDIVDMLKWHGVDEDLLRSLIMSLEEDFVYPDARSYFETCENPRILTTALSVFLQEIKLEHAMLGVPAKVTRMNKGEYIKSALFGEIGSLGVRELAPEGGYKKIHLIDDKFSQLQPLLWTEGVELTLVQRDDVKYAAKDEELDLARSAPAQFSVVSRLDEISS